MDKVKAKTLARKKRQKRVRGKISGTSMRPRLAVYRSNIGLYAQLIDDTAGHTLVSASTVDGELKGKLKSTANMDASKKVGELLAQRASGAGIKEAVFDRGGRLYHWRLKALAEAARAGGLKI